jgi:hypothetical protein
MRILTPAFVAHYSGRMINIHPSLLPSFAGLDTHRRALAAGVKLHGCTVHFVTDALDHGPIIAQAAVAVHDQDDESSLAARVLAEEHRILPQSVRWFCEGRLVIADGRVRVRGGTMIRIPDRTPMTSRTHLTVRVALCATALFLSAQAGAQQHPTGTTTLVYEFSRSGLKLAEMTDTLKVDGADTS